jgi:Domain of unknown function (DUF4349)
MQQRRLGLGGWILAVVALCTQLGLVACAKASEAPAATEAAPALAAAVNGQPTGEVAAASERKVIHRAELTLSSNDVRDTADQVVELVQRAHGYVAQRDERHSEAHVVQSQLVLRVPAPNFERVLAEVKARASVVQERVTGDDVTEEFSDVAARLRALTTMEERLLALTSSRDAVKDLLEVERELQRVRGEIERLSGRRQWLENQTAFARIELGIVSPDQPAAAGTESLLSRFGNAFADGLESSVVVLLGLIRVALTLAPFVPLAVFVVLVYRALRRRRKAHLHA